MNEKQQKFTDDVNKVMELQKQQDARIPQGAVPLGIAGEINGVTYMEGEHMLIDRVDKAGLVQQILNACESIDDALHGLSSVDDNDDGFEEPQLIFGDLSHTVHHIRMSIVNYRKGVK